MSVTAAEFNGSIRLPSSYIEILIKQEIVRLMAAKGVRLPSTEVDFLVRAHLHHTTKGAEQPQPGLPFDEVIVTYQD
jgi:hypothetical protein